MGDKLFFTFQSRFIKLPIESEMPYIASKFKGKCGFPGVVGAIDGCHIFLSILLLQIRNLIEITKNSIVLLLWPCCCMTEVFRMFLVVSLEALTIVTYFIVVLCIKSYVIRPLLCLIHSAFTSLEILLFQLNTGVYP